MFMFVSKGQIQVFMFVSKGQTQVFMFLSKVKHKCLCLFPKVKHKCLCLFPKVKHKCLCLFPKVKHKCLCLFPKVKQKCLCLFLKVKHIIINTRREAKKGSSQGRLLPHSKSALCTSAVSEGRPSADFFLCGEDGKECPPYGDAVREGSVASSDPEVMLSSGTAMLIKIILILSSQKLVGMLYDFRSSNNLNCFNNCNNKL